MADPRRIGLPDPLRRARIGADLPAVTSINTDAEVDPERVGMTSAGLERVWASVEDVYRTGIHPAIALCVRRDGEVVMDRAIGHVRGNAPNDPVDGPKELISHESPFVIASASKAITAMLVHLLDQRGLIHVDDRVGDYLPEFKTGRLADITISHVLSHRAGIPNISGDVFDMGRIDDHEFIIKTLSSKDPMWRPGRFVAYHAVSGGFILAEIIRRVTGKRLRDFLAEEILDPLGFRWGNYGVAPEDVGKVVQNAATGPILLPPLTNLFERALGLPLDEVTAVMNDPRFLTGTVPAANIVTTANELSRFFELLLRGGTLDGVEIFEARTIRRAISEQSYLEVDMTLGLPFRYGMGFMLGAKAFSLYGPKTIHAFGHLGFTNIIGWADPERGISGALLTSGKPVVAHHLYPLWAALHRVGVEASADRLATSPIFTT